MTALGGNDGSRARQYRRAAPQRTRNTLDAAGARGTPSTTPATSHHDLPGLREGRALRAACHGQRPGLEEQTQPASSTAYTGIGARQPDLVRPAIPGGLVGVMNAAEP